MAIFSGKIVSAQFIDPPNNMLIEILYREGDIVTPYTLSVDFTQQDFNDLLEEISLEQIEQNTQNQIELEKKNLDKIVEEAIEKRLGGIDRENLQYKFNTDHIKSSEVTAKDLLSVIDSKDKDLDFVFNTKIAMLEDSIVEKSEDKKLKLSIRKAKSIIELLQIYISLKE